MSLASLVDKPLMQNPLAGGGAPQIIDPSVITPRGGAPEVPQPEVYTNPVTKEILDGFSQSDFAKNVNQMQQDSRTIEINGLPITGNGSFIGNLVSYMKSVGKGDMISDNSLKQFEPLAQVSGQEGYSLLPTRPEQNPNAIRVPADPANLGSAGGPSIFPFPGMDSTETATATVSNPIDMSGILRPGMPGYTPLAPIKEGVSQDVFGNPNILAPNPMQTGDQGLMDRLTSLEQGIGSLQNQIASLFQTQQASDPFGLGGFINQRRF